MDGAPSAGTLLRSETNVLRQPEDGGSVVNYTSPVDSQPYSIPNKRWTVPVKADGIGGEYYDWSGATNPVFLTGGQLPASNTTYDTTITIEGATFYNGTGTSYYSHDGTGGYQVESSNSYYEQSSSPFYTQYSLPYYKSYGNWSGSYQVGHRDRSYYHNGSGGYTDAYTNVQYYDDNTTIGSRTEPFSLYVSQLSGEYPAGTNTYVVYVLNGEPTDSGAATSSSYYESGTRISEDNYYYWDGQGGVYYEEPYNPPSNGTPTGNTTSGSNFVEINGSNYFNGTYSGTEVHDGVGGTYWEYSYSYESYGYVFTSEWIYDMETSYGYTLYHKSNGSGGYYSES
jgi:hypothetical protein